MCAPMRLQFFGHLDVVSEGVFVLLGVEDAAGIAECGLANGVTPCADGIHRYFEVRQVVEGVEDAEDIHAALGGSAGFNPRITLSG